MATKKEVKVEEVVRGSGSETAPKVEVSELDHLRALYAELRALGVNSIGDLEVKIARLQK